MRDMVREKGRKKKEALPTRSRRDWGGGDAAN